MNTQQTALGLSLLLLSTSVANAETSKGQWQDSQSDRYNSKNSNSFWLAQNISLNNSDTTSTIIATKADYTNYQTSAAALKTSLPLNPNSLAQITNVSQLRDVSPGDWAYEALRSLVDRYGCISGFPNQTYQG
ncbi:MAG: S-layer protein, partial [Pleurocapsa sp.]